MKNYFKKVFFSLIRQNKEIFRLYTVLFSRKRKQIVANELKRLTSLENLTDEEIYTINQDLLEKALDNSFNKSEYYRKQKIVKSRNTVETLKTLPILTKKVIHDNLYEILCDGYELKDLVKRQTGGSTGTPFTFYVDKYASEKDNAQHWHLYYSMGYIKGDSIITFSGITVPQKDIDRNVFWKEEKADLLFGNYKFSSTHLNSKNFKHYFDKINSIQPKIIRSYPSSVFKLATFLKEQNLSFAFNIKGVNVTSEVLHTYQKTLIEKELRTTVYNEYGNKEMTVFAKSNGKSNILRTSPIYSYVEVVDEMGLDVKIGETGRIITTGFLNKAIPFIRYDTGDYGKVAKRNGGVIEFESIVGRSQDYIVNSEGEKIFLTGLYSQFPKTFDKIYEWQIMQDEIGKIKLLINKSNNFDQTDESNILKHTYFSNFDIKIVYTDKIEKTIAAKHQYVIQNIQI